MSDAREDYETVLMMEMAARYEEKPLQQIINKQNYLKADIVSRMSEIKAMIRWSKRLSMRGF